MTIESIGYRPSGSMCIVCAKHPHDCGLLEFSRMPQIKRDADGTIVVKCTEFRRDEELEEARRRVRESGLVTLAELTKRLEGAPEISGKVKGGRNG